MKRNYLAVTVVCIALILGGFFWYLTNEEEQKMGEGVSATGLEISSPAFENGENIPSKYTSDGSDISPPLEISGAEGEVLAIIMDDPDAPSGVFTHWLIWNIPVATDNIFEGVPQEEAIQEFGGAVQGTNDFEEIGYRGPKPPEGEKHGYRIFLYTLDSELDLGPGSTKKELVEAMKGHILQKTHLTGFYER